MERIRDQPANATELLVAWDRGEATAFDRLMPLVQGEYYRGGHAASVARAGFRCYGRGGGGRSGGRAFDHRVAEEFL
jgi:hypothetical protein